MKMKMKMKMFPLILFSCFHLYANPIDTNQDGIPDIWEEEFNLSDYLPTIPATPLYPTQIETDLSVRLDKIETFATPIENSYDPTQCDVSNFWDASRVEVGGWASGRGETVCKVHLDPATNYQLQFLTKWPINNIHYPLTPEPAWARFRFPIPLGHIANEIEYQLSWYKLFGSRPTHCHPNELNTTTGECNLDVAANWREDVDAGLYLLWTTPGSTRQVMTGPHPPIEKIGYSGISTFKVKVPEAYQDVEELVVSFVTFNQYTKACDIENPNSCTTHANQNFHLQSVTLKTEEPFLPVKEPPLSHPRILGDNSEWKAYYQPFEDLACVDSIRDTDWGMVFNAKNVWDRNTKGAIPCRDQIPDSIYEISDAQYYLNHQEGDSWNRDRALRVMFLLRDRMRCHAENQSCLYSQSDTDVLKAAFISSEMTRFESLTWDYGYCGFDIGSEPPVKFWSIFADTFWNDLNTEDKAKIDTKLAEMIGYYLDQIDTKHWSLFNGNNWTPILDQAALYWAIAYYHEDSRANRVVKEVLRTLWLHRDFYLSDGSYMEGIVEYTNVSYSNLRQINNLMRQSFGEALESVRWERTQKTSRWYLDFMAPDGKMADFGDSWDKRGWYTFDPLHMMLWEEMIGLKPIGEAELDACAVQEYFSNVWFAKGFDDPWSLQPSLARDWIGLVKECNQSTANTTKQILFDQAESGVLKSYIPHASPIAEDTTNLRFSQANATWLGFNGVPNDFPHRELDFGALIWSAYGNRLLYDFGYGEIAKTSTHRSYLIQDGTTELWDNLALGANTLVVEDATDEHYTGGSYNDDWINSSQIYGARGTLESLEVDGLQAFVADGSLVYGKEDEEFGWLDFFYRYLIALEDGNYIVIDSFTTKADRGAATVKEYWYSADEEENTTTCAYHYEKVALSLENNHTVQLKPLCAMLPREANSTVTARIVGNSLEGGRFTIDPETIAYKTRTSVKAVRNRFTYGATTPLEKDIRLFLLQAVPQGELPDANISANLCDEQTPCFDIRVADSIRRLHFTFNEEGNYILGEVHPVMTRELHAGWNLIGWNQKLTLAELQAALGAENIEVIQGAETAYQKRYRENHLDFLNDFTTTEAGEGYWLYLHHAASLNLEDIVSGGNISLKKGWNLISPYAPLSLYAVRKQIGAENLLAIQGESLTPIEQLETYHGYAIQVAEDTLLSF